MGRLRQLLADAGESDRERVPKILLRVDEVQESMGLSRSKIYSLVSQGRLPCVKIGKGRGSGVRFRPEDLRAFAEKHLVSGGPA